MNNLKCGLFLQALRKSKGLTQKELADYFEISDKTVSKWECGDSLPEIPMLKALAEYYDVTVDEILNGERGESKIGLKSKIENEKYFYNKKIHKLNFSFILAISILLISYLLIFVIGYTTQRCDLGCWVSLCITVLSGIVYAFGLLFTGNLELSIENSEEQTRFKRRRFWYSYGFVFNFLFVLTMAILFYAIPPVNNSIIKFGYFCLYNFAVFVLVMSVAGIFPLVRLGYKGYNKSNVKVFYLILAYLLTAFIPIIMLFSYSFNELIVESIKINYLVFWLFWVGFALALTGPFLMFYAVYKKKNYLPIFLIQALAYIFIWIALIDISTNYSSMTQLNDCLLFCTIVLIVFILLEIILVIRRHKKEGSIEEV